MVLMGSRIGDDPVEDAEEDDSAPLAGDASSRSSFMTVYVLLPNLVVVS